MTFYSLVGDINFSEEHAASVFRIVVLRVRNMLGNITRSPYSTHFNPEEVSTIFLGNVGIHL
jgi:hypothetical protein